MATVNLQLHQIHVFHIVAHLFHHLHVVFQWGLLVFCNSLLPVVHEISGLLSEGLDLFGRETHLDVVLIGDPVNRGLQTEVAEGGLLAGADVDHGPAFLECRLAALVAWEEVCADGVFHHGIARNAVFVELHFDFRFFSGLVDPIGMIGHGHPQVVAAVGIVLCR